MGDGLRHWIFAASSLNGKVHIFRGIDEEDLKKQHRKYHEKVGKERKKGC